ncbi:FeoB-associated Cys-rich membrane protein [Schinkia sp. CFF1]
MVANTIIGLVIFGYAGYALMKYIKNSKKGKCAGCAVQNSCKKDKCI